VSQEHAIKVSWMTNAGEHVERHTSAFCIGRDAHGQLSLDEQQVEVAHTAVFVRDGQWWMRNLDGATTTLLNGKPFQDAPSPLRGVIQFANSSTPVMLEIEAVADSALRPTVRVQQPNVAAHAARAQPAQATGPSPTPSAAPAARTVLASRVAQNVPAATARTEGPPISIQAGPGAPAREYTDTVRLGRGDDCTIRITDDGVSRAHAEIFRLGPQWCVRDLGSSNGTYVDGNRVDQAPLPGRCTVRLGVDGAQIEVSYAATTSVGGPNAPKSMDEVAAHYFDPKSQAPAGQHTMMVRKAFTAVQQKQKRKYGSVIAGALVLLLVAVGVGIFQYVQLQRTRAIAEQLFYNMKTVELQLSRLEEQVLETGNPEQLAQAAKSRAQLADMASQYDSLLAEMGFISEKTAPEDRIIIEMARKFGEFELGMPKDFIAEVKRYIALWRADQRLEKALERAQAQQLSPIIGEALQRHHLPPQFFYLALQESDFRSDAVGPQTRFGIAKGMWQFIPTTANQYGLQVGPLIEHPGFDPDDQRFDPVAASDAAARYLADLYRDEAQASGLLVLASYNWGTTRVRDRIRAMKENPRDRNFWALLAQTDVPKETRDYVFRIFSAAVIGEDPRLFGFDFEKPLTPQ
jgi:membrane-bound lytic murein transglycosylase D